MKDRRPVNLKISSITMPLTAYASITHRVSGVLVFFGIALLLWLLDRSLASEAGFEAMREASRSPWLKLLTWLVLSALAYHTLAGFRHLLMDVDIGESKQGGKVGAMLTFAGSIVLAIIIGVWLW